ASGIQRSILRPDQISRCLEEVAVECAAESSVGSNDHQRNTTDLALFKKRTDRDLDVGGKELQQFAQLLTVGPSGDDAVLCATKLRSGDHLHRLRDLRGVLDTLNAVAYLAVLCHERIRLIGRPPMNGVGYAHEA